jgi:tetratricopeptide (TPR) repeat protein
MQTQTDVAINGHKIKELTPMERRFSFFTKGIEVAAKAPERTVTLQEVLELIMFDEFKQETEELRKISKTTRKDENDNFKKKCLAYVTFSGTFLERKKAKLIQHSGLICLDIDRLTPEKIKKVKAAIRFCGYSLAAFTSPNGDGVKAIFPMPPDPSLQEIYYKAYSQILIEQCYVNAENIDKSCKDVSRACFLSHDPEIIFSEPQLYLTDKQLNGLAAEFDQAGRPEPPQPTLANHRPTYSAEGIAGKVYTDADKRRMIDSEIKRILNSGDGSKHNDLNKAAYTIGDYVYQNWISQNEAEFKLWEAIQIHPNVADLNRAWDTIQKGIREGMANPIKPKLAPLSAYNGKTNGGHQTAPPEALTGLKTALNEDEEKRKALFDEMEALCNSIELDQEEDVPPPQTCLEVWEGYDKIILGTLGNVSTITGKAKSRKTFFVAWLLGAAIKNGLVKSKIKGSLPADQSVCLLFDTEQGKHHVSKLTKRALRLAGLQKSQNFRTFPLRRFDTNKRLAIIEHKIYNTPNLGFVVIDGIRDLVFSINDEHQATMMCSKLLKWSEELNIHIVCVLHQNKGKTNDDPRGHIGTELINKSEMVISIKKDPENREVSSVEVEQSREKEFSPFAFLIDDDGLPDLIEDWESKPARAGQKKALTPSDLDQHSHKEILTQVFKDNTRQSYGELVINFKKEYGKMRGKIGDSKIREFVDFYLEQEYLIKEGKERTVHAKYLLSPSYVS